MLTPSASEGSVIESEAPIKDEFGLRTPEGSVTRLECAVGDTSDTDAVAPQEQRLPQRPDVEASQDSSTSIPRDAVHEPSSKAAPGDPAGMVPLQGTSATSPTSATSAGYATHGIPSNAYHSPLPSPWTASYPQMAPGPYWQCHQAWSSTAFPQFPQASYPYRGPGAAYEASWTAYQPYPAAAAAPVAPAYPYQPCPAPSASEPHPGWKLAWVPSGYSGYEQQQQRQQQPPPYWGFPMPKHVHQHPSRATIPIRPAADVIRTAPAHPVAPIVPVKPAKRPVGPPKTPPKPVKPTKRSSDEDDDKDDEAEVVAAKRRKYTCQWEGCGKTFTTSGNLCRHRALHLQIQPFHCPIEGCTMKFSRADSLKDHHASHLRRINAAKAAAKKKKESGDGE